MASQIKRQRKPAGHVIKAIRQPLGHVAHQKIVSGEPRGGTVSVPAHQGAVKESHTNVYAMPRHFGGTELFT